MPAAAPSLHTRLIGYIRDISQHLQLAGRQKPVPPTPTTRRARAPADHAPIRGLEQACSNIVVKSLHRHRLHPVQTACNGAYLRGGSTAPAALYTIDSTAAMCRQQPAAECPHLLTTVPMHARDVDALSEWRVFPSTEMSKSRRCVDYAKLLVRPQGRPPSAPTGNATPSACASRAPADASTSLCHCSDC